MVEVLREWTSEDGEVRASADETNGTGEDGIDIVWPVPSGDPRYHRSFSQCLPGTTS